MRLDFSSFIITGPSTSTVSVAKTIGGQVEKKVAVLGKEVCNGGVACSCLQLRSLEKTVRASLIALWFVLRPPFFLEKKMSHVMLVNDLRRKVMSFFLQKKTQHFFYGAKLIFKLFATFFGLTIF